MPSNIYIKIKIKSNKRKKLEIWSEIKDINGKTCILALMILLFIIIKITFP